MSTESLTTAMSYAEDTGSLEDINHVLKLVDTYRMKHPQMYNTLNIIETDYRRRRDKLAPPKEIKAAYTEEVNPNPWKNYDKWGDDL